MRHEAPTATFSSINSKYELYFWLNLFEIALRCIFSHFIDFLNECCERNLVDTQLYGILSLEYV